LSYLNDDDDFVRLSAEEQVDEKQEADFAIQIGMFAVPIIIIHLLIVYMFISATTGWHLSSVVTEMLLPFFFISGGLIGFAIFYWRKGYPIAAKIRLTGWKGRYMIAAAILIPFASFIAPQMTAELLRFIASLFQ